MTPAVHILGIRHHGPGSARSLRRALDEIRPDMVLVEGPPDADDLIPLLAHPEMKPPVALLVYAADQPRVAVYYPFAAFSPEWQAIGHALENRVPVRFMDLPQAHQLLAEATEPEDEEATETQIQTEPEPPPEPEPRHDPLRWLAEAAGFSDGERWWEHMVEHRRDGSNLFAAILEAMTALRDEFPETLNPREARREAHMRQTIRAAEAEGFSRIAVVCGAWHAPALARQSDAKADAATLKGLPKAKVSATWVPWTHGRLAFASGYGAGVESPGWYHHLWQHSSLVVERWVTRIARLLRAKDLDASSAHVIETVRLAETLAALRGRPLPGLPELNEAVQAVLCLGDPLPMRLIHDALIVGETLGEVPAETPSVPLQQDLVREQKRLRLKPEAGQTVEDLDLRKPNDLDRSYLLHRLALLGIPWGETQGTSGKKGTFHEVWRLQWQPEFSIALIEAGRWGNTIFDASTAKARDLADRAPDLPALTVLLDRALLAELPGAVAHLTARIDTEAAVASDVAHLMGALPPLANVLRYGDVRKTDTSTIARVVAGLVARVCVNLPGACGSLDDDAASAMFDRILQVDAAIGLLQNEEHRSEWQAVLRRMADSPNMHGLIQGRCCRLLLDAGLFGAEEVARRLNLGLSVAAEPTQAAAWVEGLLKGSGLILLHDQALWDVLDGWVAALPPDAFLPVLPLIRRTFATFAPPERRQMGERARRGPAKPSAVAEATGLDLARAKAVLPLISMLLGIPTTNAGHPDVSAWHETQEGTTMLYYPKIPGSRDAPLGRCVAFEKSDGTNLYWDWDREFGWHSFGTRRDEFDLSDTGIGRFTATHAHLHECAGVFLSTLAEGLEKVFTDNEAYRPLGGFRVFTEFLGPNSFAGLPKADDPKVLVPFDVRAEPSGMLGPDAFVADFGHLPIARVVYRGKLTGKFAEDVRTGKYGVSEGVVCKGGTGGTDLWMAKIKTYAYLERLKQAFGERWEDYWE